MSIAQINAFFLIIGLLFSNLCLAATLTASVNRNKMSINDVLNLQLRYDAKPSSDQLDMSALKQDFDILSVRPQSSSNISIINGKTTKEELTFWHITLAPKRQGALVIPSFNIDGNVSNAIRVDVADASAAILQDQPMLVRLTPSTETAYPGQQILIKVELLAQNTVSNLSGDQLRLDGAEVELLDQKSTRRVENGISWQVVEWIYAVFPQQAGQLELPPQLFSGVIQSTPQRNMFDPFRQQRGRRISARSSATSISVQDIPESNGLPWFPANNIRIQSSWSGDTSQMRVGEPLTRTIQIIAEGQRASVIPPLPENSSLTYKTYKDQPQLENRPTASGLVGIRQESEAIVPSAAGLLELPEQQLTWWDSTSNSWQQAVLPAETYEVLPAEQSTSFAPPEGAPVFLPEGNSTASVVVEKTSLWWKLATTLLAILCILQFWLLIKRQPVTPANTESEQRSSLSLNKAWKDLQKALKNADGQKVRTALLAWVQIATQEPGMLTFTSLLRYLQASGNEQLARSLREELHKLDESLYKGNSTMDFANLAALINELNLSLKPKEQSTGGLPSLYPN